MLAIELLYTHELLTNKKQKIMKRGYILRGGALIERAGEMFKVLFCALIVSVSAMERDVVRVEQWSNGEFYACYDDGTKEKITKERYEVELARMLKESNGIIVTK